jgi:asparagine synthase (glutamine-hydrolysing)
MGERRSPDFYDRLAAPLIPLLPERLSHGRVGDKVHKAARLLTMQRPDDRYLCSDWTDPAAIVLGSREPPTM